MIGFLKSRDKEKGERYYKNSTQSWLPIDTIADGIVCLKDGRYIKIMEILPVNFYLKSNTEQENIIYYFASYLKIAPDNIQIRVTTERASIENYLKMHSEYAEKEVNERAQAMIGDEMNFVKMLSDNVAIKKRFYLIVEYTGKGFNSSGVKFADVIRELTDEVYKAQRYLSQCELTVVDICDNGQLLDLLYAFINKHTSKFVKPGNFAEGMFDEVHTFEGGDEDEQGE